MDSEIRVVFRKSVAIIETPAVLYAYLNRPVQAIIGRAPLEKISRHKLDECLSMSKKSGYSLEDIRDYVDERSVIVYSLGQFQKAPKPIAVSELRTAYGFVPTPQAILLSKDGLTELDARLGFRKPC